MIRFVLFALVLMLSACGAPQSSAPVNIPSGTVIGDRDPVSFAGRAPTTYPVRGIDVARFQKFVDWRLAARAGVKFAFIKATEGGDLKDPMFRTHWSGAARAGVARGAYHFYYFCTPPATQARWFIRNVPKARGALPPVLDMEWNPFSPTCKRRPDGATVRREMRIWLNMIEAHYGQRPIIYTTPGFYKDAGLSQMRGEEFWLRATAQRPAEVYPGQPWRFWQYTSTAIVPGIPGDVDVNTFNGTAEDWAAWIAARAR